MSTIISCIVLIALIFIFFALSKQKQDSLLHLLLTKQTAKLEEELNSFWTRIFIPKYNFEYIKLNFSILQNDKNMIDQQFKLLFSMKKNANQSEDLLKKSFNFYLESNDKEKCKSILNKMPLNSPLKDEAQMMYDIILDKSANYIHELIDKAESCNGEDKAICYLLVSRQYKNINDSVNAKKYQDLAHSVSKSQ